MERISLRVERSSKLTTMPASCRSRSTSPRRRELSYRTCVSVAARFQGRKRYGRRSGTWVHGRASITATVSSARFHRVSDTITWLADSAGTARTTPLQRAEEGGCGRGKMRRASSRSRRTGLQTQSWSRTTRPSSKSQAMTCGACISQKTPWQPRTRSSCRFAPFWPPCWACGCALAVRIVRRQSGPVKTPWVVLQS